MRDKLTEKEDLYLPQTTYKQGIFTYQMKQISLHLLIRLKIWTENLFFFLRDLETLISSNVQGVELQNKIETYLFNSENHFNSLNKSKKNPSIDFSSQTSK